jgi:hypothetical protein
MPGCILYSGAQGYVGHVRCAKRLIDTARTEADFETLYSTAQNGSDSEHKDGRRESVGIVSDRPEDEQFTSVKPRGICGDRVRKEVARKEKIGRQRYGA